MRILFITPSLYIPGGVERELTLKLNWLARHTDWELFVCLTDGEGKPPYYPLDERIKVVNLNIGFEELWHLPFYRKIPVYLRKQRLYRQRLRDLLFEIRPDITDSLLRREINFLCDIRDGSAKMGELHVNRRNYRNFESHETNFLKEAFSKVWMHVLVKQLRRLDRFVVLTHEDAANWPEVPHVQVMPNPVEHQAGSPCHGEQKVVIAVGRYSYQKGFDLLLQAWQKVQEKHPDWQLHVFGGGERAPYEQMAGDLGITQSVRLNPPTSRIGEEFMASSLFVLSSRFEGFPMVLIEALGYGMPIVSYTCPCGPKDCLKDGVNGLLVPEGNIPMLAESINWMIEHPEERKRMGKEAHLTARRYHIDAIMPQWVGLFEELAKKKDEGL